MEASAKSPFAAAKSGAGALPSTSVSWFYEDGSKFKPMSRDGCQKLEAARFEAARFCTLTVGQWTYKYDLQALTQTNTTTDVTRKIRWVSTSLCVCLHAAS